MEKAGRSFFEKYTQYKLDQVELFLSEDFIAKEIASQILEDKQINYELMVERLADDFGLPKVHHRSEWPSGIDPHELFKRFFNELKKSLAKDSDPGVFWVGSRLNELTTILQRFTLDIKTIPVQTAKILDEASKARQKDEWLAFEESYLGHIQKRSERLTTPGVREFRDVKQSLSIAYISLKIKEKGSGGPIRAEEFLVENELLVVRGPAGSGKTTLLN